MDTKIFSQNGFELSPKESELFENYLALFLEYNAHTNLSAIRDEGGVIEKHFIDSLYGAEVILSDLWDRVDQWSLRLLDIGSGWGFPGVPLKIVIPELDVTLLDSVGKKVKAMNHFIHELWLENIVAIQERAEILAKDPKHNAKYDFVVSRATAYITDILKWSLPFLQPKWKIILYKMPSEDEMGDLKKIMKKAWVELTGELKYEIQGSKRVLLVLERK
jgi:16S rRNA (guanine527-N7)-methyltransferase